MPTRREFLKTSLLGAAMLGQADGTPESSSAPATSRDTFELWCFSDAHVGTDKKQGRESLVEAVRHSEFGGPNGAPSFEWEIALDMGDMAGAVRLPTDVEGQKIVRQFRALKKHRREDIYNLGGNHDRSGLDEPKNWWWRKWLDPTGEHAKYSGVDNAKRRYPVEGTWERYSFRVGNILFLMMSDINEPTQKIGRGPLGGNPGGVVTGETFAWWKKMVETNPDSIIISAHHYVLKNTTVASGEWEGMRKDVTGQWRSHYHGYKPQGSPKGASYLYWVDSKPDAQAFENYLAEHPGAIDFWFGGHTHTFPDDTYGGKSHIETKWGVHFINVGQLTQYHGLESATPMSRVLTFSGDEVRVRCYLHTNEYATMGWYPKSERILRLAKAFRR